MIPGQEELWNQIIHSTTSGESSYEESRDDRTSCWTMITGPSGIGKTFVCEKLLAHFHPHAYLINCQDLISKNSNVIGHCEYILERKLSQYKILILDDFDAILSSSSANNPTTTTQVQSNLTLKHYLRQLLLRNSRQNQKRVILVGRPLELDPGLSKCFSLQLSIQVTTPEQRRLMAEHLVSTQDDIKKVPDAETFVALAEAKFGMIPKDMRDLLDDNINAIIKGLSTWEDVFKVFRPKILTDFVLNTSIDYKLEELFGMQSAIDRLHASLVEPFMHPHIYKALNLQPPKGIILYGPSGCGKTHLALAALKNAASSSSYSLNYVPIDTAVLRSKLVGETEKRLAQVFQAARLCSPCVLFFDRLELLMGKRNIEEDEEEEVTFQRLVSCFLTEMDGLLAKQQRDKLVIVLGTTEDISLLDPAIIRPGRLGTHIPVPSSLTDTAKMDMLNYYCEHFPLSLTISQKQLIIDRSKVDKECNINTGAQFKQLFVDADFIASRRQKSCIEYDDFFQVERQKTDSWLKTNFVATL